MRAAVRAVVRAVVAVAVTAMAQEETDLEAEAAKKNEPLHLCDEH